MVRDATRLGFRIDAVAFSGTLYLLSYWNVTFILSPAGSILSIVPDLDTHDLDLVAGIERQRLGEVRDHGLGGQLLVHVPAEDRAHDGHHQHDGPDDHRHLGHLEIPDVENCRHRARPLPLRSRWEERWITRQQRLVRGRGCGSRPRRWRRPGQGRRQRRDARGEVRRRGLRGQRHGAGTGRGGRQRRPAHPAPAATAGRGSPRPARPELGCGPWIFGSEVATFGGGYPPGTGPYGPWVRSAHGSGSPGFGRPSAGGV